MKLFIVESPGKVKTIQKYLPDEFYVMASVGHIMEIPRNGLNINVDNGSFDIDVHTIQGKEKVVAEIKEKSKLADEIFICTDCDREGERIAFDVACVIEDEDKHKIKRAEFYEITKKAVNQAVKNPRNINLNLVNSQVTRQILDRLIGYLVSPMVWDAVPGGKSAGRVQSVALGLIAEREFQIREFVSEKFWDIPVEFKIGEEKVPGIVKTNLKNRFIDKDLALAAKKEILENDCIVSKVLSSKAKKIPYPPFDTASLQKAASSVLNFSGKETMEICQKLYEAGFQTYLRTDSFSVSDDAYNMCKEYISEKFTDKYLPKERRVYAKKTANSQEAHECIRPTHLGLGEPEENDLTENERKLYDLVKSRFIASQMQDMLSQKVAVDITSGSQIIGLEARTILFDGWSSVWKSDSKESFLPEISEKQILELSNIEVKDHETRPPDRYNDGSLVAKMEKEGVGRPSTWATLVDNLLSRGYVNKEGKNFYLTLIGENIYLFLNKKFSDFFMNVGFTSSIEEKLDKICQGEINKLEILRDFYDLLNKAINKDRDNYLLSVFGG